MGKDGASLDMGHFCPISRLAPSSLLRPPNPQIPFQNTSVLTSVSSRNSVPIRHPQYGVWTLSLPQSFQNPKIRDFVPLRKRRFLNIEKAGPLPPTWPAI